MVHDAEDLQGNGLVSVEREQKSALSLHRFVLAQSDADVALKAFLSTALHIPATDPKKTTPTPLSPSPVDQHMALA